ncbi:MAG: hypothetical protein BIFFINMI_00074 [Phycisphaerae bacterium]|nr:hypothetical protein [Phycisphaerae bacterium]
MTANTRDRLIEKAYSLFGHHGFHAVGLDRIIAEVGVTKTTFYNHFQSKDDLVLAVLTYRDEIESGYFRDKLGELGGRSARGQLLAVLDALAAWFNEPEFRGCIFITAAAEFPSPHEPAHQVAAGHYETLRRHIEELAEEAGCASPDHVSEQICLLMQGAIVMRHLAGNHAAADVARPAFDRLIRQHLSGADPAAAG